MKILITGSRGFVGSATTKVIESVPKENNTNFVSEHEVVHYDLINGYDIRDAAQFEKVLEHHKPDRVLHLAAIARFSEADANPRLAHETNVLGTRNVAMIAGKHHIPIVYASTGSCYMPINEEPPITEEFPVRGNSVYGVTKTLGELYIQEYSSLYIILRYAHLYGREKRHHGLIGGFLSRIERGLAPTLYGGQQSNDFTYIADVARANKMALEAPFDAWNNVYNIGTSEELTAKQAADAIIKVTGYKGEIKLEKQREVDPARFVFNIEKAKRYLGWEPQYTFEQGLQDMFSVAK